MRNCTLSILAAALAVLLATAADAPAQDPMASLPGGGEMVDRVAAVVGDSVILASQIEEQILRLEAQGMQRPQSEVELQMLRRQVLENMVDEQLIVQAAASDTLIDVSDERVQAIVEENVREMAQRLGGETALQQALEETGQTLSDYREGMTEEIRRQLLIQHYLELQQQQARPAGVGEEELRRFYEEQREQLEARPATVSFRQVVIQPQVSEEARGEARQRAEELRQRIVDGEDLADVARRFSDDPGSRDQGGDLGWFRRSGDLVQEFEDAAFSLRQGQLSPVVESSFGAHIIRVDRVRGGERRISHVLVRTELTDADLERTRELAREVKERLEGGESVTRLTDEFSTVDVPDSLSVTMDQLGQLPGDYASALADAGPGDVVGPLEFEYQGQLTLAVVKVEDVRDEGEYTFEDLRERIQDHLTTEQLQERIIERLRDQYHVEIRI